MGARPNYGWMAEESAEEEGTDPTRRWIVDPLDGTTNFLHGLPHFAISIALEHKGQIVAGVVYDPAKDEMFYAERGTGAWLNDSKRLRVSGRHKMIEAVFATGIPFAAKNTLPATLRDLAKIMPECAGVRRFGSAALDLAYVAAGRYDGYWERELNLWDVAAGYLIAKEAGALIDEAIRRHHRSRHDHFFPRSSREERARGSKVLMVAKTKSTSMPAAGLVRPRASFGAIIVAPPIWQR